MTAAEKLGMTPPCKLILSSEDYHKHAAVGSSSLKKVLRSPAHYKYDLENPSEATPSQEFGTAAHMALLEPDKFQEMMAIKPKFSGTGARAKQDQWEAENHGKIKLSADQYADILGMRESLLKCKTAYNLLSGGKAEESYFDVCPETGIARKARPDFLRDGHIIVDIKTTTDARESEFMRSIAAYQYHLSAAYYLDVVTSVTGQKYNEFVIVAVEKAPPYGVAVYHLCDQTIGAGRHLYRKALTSLAACQKHNNFHGYPDKVQSISLPPWAFPQEVSE
jgi:hypothetical protein